MEPMRRPEQAETARKLWEAARGKAITLKEALQVCHDAHRLAPFAFNNGNTFAAMAQTLVSEFVKELPPLPAQMLRSTVCHFVVGRVGHRELSQILQHIAPKLGQVPVASPSTSTSASTSASTSPSTSVPAPSTTPVRSQLAVAATPQR